MVDMGAGRSMNVMLVLMGGRRVTDWSRRQRRCKCLLEWVEAFVFEMCDKSTYAASDLRGLHRLQLHASRAMLFLYKR